MKPEKVKQKRSKREDRDEDAPSLREAMKDDKVYVKYREIMRSPGIDTDEAFNSMLDLHDKRFMRGMTEHDPKKLQKALLKDQQARSSMTTHLVNAQREFAMLKVAHKAISDHIVSSYKHALDGRTQADRNAALRRFLDRGEQRIATLERFIEICITFIADVDAARFSLQSIGAQTKITNQSEYHG
jgi:hypothetical protein